MKQRLYTTVALVVGIVVMINLLATEFHFRLDLTEGKQYTLSKATKDILHQLDEPVTVTAYFSQNLPPSIEKTRKDFHDLLIEYAEAAKGMVLYKFVNPADKETSEQEAIKKGIRPVMINVREKDQMKQQKAYLGATVALGKKQEAIPLLRPGAAMEYALSTAIKKLSVTHKPVIGFLQGHGEASIGELAQLDQQLDVLYKTQPVTLTDSTGIPADIHTLAIIRPTDSISPVQLSKLDSFLDRGGRMLIAAKHVEGNLQIGQGSTMHTGLDAWLTQKGLKIDDDLVIDAQCGSVSIPQREGGFTFQTELSLPYLPIVADFAKHPVTAGLESVLLEFPSSVSHTGHGKLQYTPLAFSSARSDTLGVPVFLDMNKQWKESDFGKSHLPVAAALQGSFGGKGSAASKMIVIADGDFVINGAGQRQRQVNPDNVNFVSNAIDWLSDDTGLITLRTKGVTSRPIEQMSDGSKSLIKYFNFLLPVLLAIGYGLYRARNSRLLREKRMEEDYEAPAS